jgi:mitochondrial distribution and morphology protein 34
MITLSEIKLSAFIIVVFSKQKGLTIVFRNDPLESLKVSSTFDSIQFVRDYLQRTIEGKLRELIMDELPAIIHRLSLQLWCPDQILKEDGSTANEDGEVLIDPLAEPPLDAVDAFGNRVDAAEISAIAANGGAALHALFSQKNLLHLSDLTSSNRTFALHTPSIGDALFRAWARPDRPDPTNSPPLAAPSLIRAHSYHASTTSFSSDSGSTGALSSRPSFVSLGSATTGLSLGANRHSRTHGGRKKKNRVVNLRKKASTQPNSEAGDSIADTESVLGPLSEPLMTPSIAEEPEEETLIGTMSTAGRVRFRTGDDKIHLPSRQTLNLDMYTAPETIDARLQSRSADAVPTLSSFQEIRKEKTKEALLMDEKSPLEFGRRRQGPSSDTSSVILEQAWISKMASEIARRVYDEKQRNPRFWEDREDVPPPAYEAA